MSKGVFFEGTPAWLPSETITQQWNSFIEKRESTNKQFLIYYLSKFCSFFQSAGNIRDIKLYHKENPIRVKIECRNDVIPYNSTAFSNHFFGICRGQTLNKGRLLYYLTISSNSLRPSIFFYFTLAMPELLNQSKNSGFGLPFFKLTSGMFNYRVGNFNFKKEMIFIRTTTPHFGQGFYFGRFLKGSAIEKNFGYDLEPNKYYKATTMFNLSSNFDRIPLSYKGFLEVGTIHIDSKRAAPFLKANIKEKLSFGKLSFRFSQGFSQAGFKIFGMNPINLPYREQLIIADKQLCNGLDGNSFTKKQLGVLQHWDRYLLSGVQYTLFKEPNGKCTLFANGGISKLSHPANFLQKDTKWSFYGSIGTGVNFPVSPHLIRRYFRRIFLKNSEDCITQVGYNHIYFGIAINYQKINGPSTSMNLIIFPFQTSSLSDSFKSTSIGRYND